MWPPRCGTTSYINEGMATYAESQFPFEGAGSSTTTTETAIYNLWNGTASSNGAFTTSAGCDDAGLVSCSAPTSTTRGAMSARGAAHLDRCRLPSRPLMRQYQLTYSGGQIAGRRTAAFKAMAESISGRDLTSFFNTWWFTTGKPAWPAKFNLNLAGPTTPGGTRATPRPTRCRSRNTGKVAHDRRQAVVTVDLADVLDDATLGTLPANVTLDGTTLTWAVPVHRARAPPAAWRSRPRSTAGDHGQHAARPSPGATTLGSTCLECAPSVVVGSTTDQPRAQPDDHRRGTPTVGGPADRRHRAAGLPAPPSTYQWLVDGTPIPGATAAYLHPGRRRRRPSP